MMDSFFEKINRSKALVIGDLMLDEYLWGAAERISPEAPVPVFRVTCEEHRLGGAANVALNLAVLGCQVTLAGVVGDDQERQLLHSLIKKAGIADGCVLTSTRKRTTRKSRLIAQQQQMIRIDREDTTTITTEEEQQLIDACRKLIPGVNIVLLSDYKKGVLTPKVVREIIAECSQRGVPVIVDPKGTDYNCYRGATLLTPNRKELGLAVGCDIDSETTLVREAEKLRESLDIEALVVTRSDEGMSLFCRDESPRHLPTVAREVFDISGAGDTVLSTLGAALAVRLDLISAVKLANQAAGIVVGKVGTSTVLPWELRRSVEVEDLGALGKICTREQLVDVLKGDKKDGRKIVFTNGCFDLLHVGHVKCLEKAKQKGDILVLGLNSDASIRRLKGHKRPLIGQDERSHILAALNCVDYVVLFEEDTPLELIQLVQPDILVKGGDYSPDEVVGREFVESYGGKLELIQFVDGKSSSNIINKILESYQDE